jgi:hypothetical protein
LPSQLRPFLLILAATAIGGVSVGSAEGNGDPTHRSSSGCTHKYGSISRCFVSLIMCTGGEYRGVRQDRHFQRRLDDLVLMEGDYSGP